MPDRAIPSDRRILRDGRWGIYSIQSAIAVVRNMRKLRILRIESPTCVVHIRESTYILVNKRDVGSASKLVRIHPDFAKLFPTEFAGRFFGLSSSVVPFYLVLPFGWSGSPGCFAYMASGIPKWNNAHAPNFPETSGEEPFSSFLFDGDGILIQPELGTRCIEGALRRDKGRRLKYGMDSVNHDKPEDEGNWESQKLAPIHLLNTNNWEIPIREGKIRGAKSLTQARYLNPGNRISPLQILQEQRGNIAHWSKTGRIWNRVVHPIDRMLCFSDIRGLWARCNDVNDWAAFLHVLHFVRQVASDDADWARIFTGQMTRLVPMRGAISGHSQTIPILWTSCDATLNRIGAINWRTREFSFETLQDIIDPFVGLRPKGFISDFEYLVDIGAILLWGGFTRRKSYSMLPTDGWNSRAGWAF